MLVCGKQLTWRRAWLCGRMRPQGRASGADADPGQYWLYRVPDASVSESAQLAAMLPVVPS